MVVARLRQRLVHDRPLVRDVVLCGCVFFAGEGGGVERVLTRVLNQTRTHIRMYVYIYMYMYINNKLQHSKINPTTLTAQREPLHRVADHARGQHQVRQGLDAIYVYIICVCTCVYFGVRVWLFDLDFFDDSAW